MLLRADLNVPMKDGKVSDRTRIERLAPTIRELAERGARVVVMSHFGRPKGKPEAEHSLRPLVAPLAKAIGGGRSPSPRIASARRRERVVAALKPGDVALLENLRFHARGGEERPGLRQAACRAWRSLCQRRLLRGASRACLDRGAGASAAGGGRDG